MTVLLHGGVLCLADIPLLIMWASWMWPPALAMYGAWRGYRTTEGEK